VWICADAFIGPAVVIHEGAVVGARSAVFQDVEPWSVVGGNPARKLKSRTLTTAEEHPGADKET
jgi:putative colanic acid biosynthesis acetyltransferase WcaF